MTIESANEFIRVRDAATAGPWEYSEWMIGSFQNGMCSVICYTGTSKASRNPQSESDGLLIAHARNTTLPEEHLAALAELEGVKAALSQYRDFLQAKYPATDGEEWSFTCPHHQAIEAALNPSIRERIESEVGE